MANQTRRNLLKGIAAAGAVGLMTVSRDEVGKVLHKLSDEELLGYVYEEGEYVISEYSPYKTPEEIKELAKKKEEMAKKKCMESANSICQRLGENSPECRLARKHCEEIKVKWTG